MNYESYFPLGIATGQAFIGRAEDTEWLNKNIEAGIHTLLLAPRRYGKSSLVLQVLENKKLAFVEIDLQLCRTGKSVELKILRGVENIISAAIKEKGKVLQTAKSFFSKSKKQWNIGLKGFVQVTIEPDKYDDVADNILTALQFLEAALSDEDKKAVIFIDEMQKIIHLDESEEVQGAIRHFAQKSKRVHFIFSGSSRGLLRQMFNDNAKPLYQLCDNVTLCKIKEECYLSYIKKVAKKTLNLQVSDDAIHKIIDLSERHPRRIYNLCLYFWRLIDSGKKEANESTVLEAWEKLIFSEAKGTRYFLSKLNNSQLKVLAYLSLKGNKELTSKQAQGTTDLSGSAISKALHSLEEEDLIEKHEDGTYHIIDPIIKGIINMYENELLE
jgi:AAA+ ATPase superfamily predicted ATPase